VDRLQEVCQEDPYEAVFSRYLTLLVYLFADILQALTASISMSNGEFMHISNSILVLKEVLPVFPLGMIQDSTGQFLDDALQKLLSEEKRGDIKILATSYQGQLRMAKREWAPPDQASVGAEVNTLSMKLRVN